MDKKKDLGGEDDARHHSAEACPGFVQLDLSVQLDLYFRHHLSLRPMYFSAFPIRLLNLNGYLYSLRINKESYQIDGEFCMTFA